MQADRLTRIGELGPELRVQAGNGSRDRDRFGPGDHLLDKGPSAAAALTDCTEDTVQKLTDGDDADRPVLVADQLLDRPPGLLMLDEQIRVDQDCQGSSG